MANERQARGWSQADAVRAIRVHHSQKHSDKEPHAGRLARKAKTRGR
jgi:hypothetical protein